VVADLHAIDIHFPHLSPTESSVADAMQAPAQRPAPLHILVPNKSQEAETSSDTRVQLCSGINMLAPNSGEISGDAQIAATH